MPNFSEHQIPPPKHWQVFESLCWDLWKRIWSDPGTQKHGRSGQPQSGVDVYGRCKGSWCGVQAKGKDSLTNQQVSIAELEAEVAKARSFEPRLKEFVLATSGAKDVRVEEAARIITDSNVQSGSFTVSVFGWEDILLLLEDYPDVLAKYYPWIASSGTDWTKRQSSSISTYAFPCAIKLNEGEIDATQAHDVFERLQRFIALACWVAADTTPYDDFTYLLTFEKTDVSVSGYQAFYVEIFCHLTLFVDVFRGLCQSQLEFRGTEYPKEATRVPDDAVVSINAARGKLVPHRVWRTNQESVEIQELVSRRDLCPSPDTASGLLVLIHAMACRKMIIWDDFEWTPATEKVVGFMAFINDSGCSPFDQVVLSRTDPESWSCRTEA